MMVKSTRPCPVAFVPGRPDLSGVEDTQETRAAVGERIREARLSAGLDNASEFGRRVGVTPTTVYRWERGQVVPSIFTLHDVARVCRVSMEWLLTGATSSHGEALEAWLASPQGQSAGPELRSFLEALPLDGYEPSTLFYELAATAWRNGLTPEEASQAARATESFRG